MAARDRHRRGAALIGSLAQLPALPGAPAPALARPLLNAARLAAAGADGGKAHAAGHRGRRRGDVGQKLRLAGLRQVGVQLPVARLAPAGGYTQRGGV